MNGPRHRISLTSSMQSFNSIWIPALQMRTTSVTSISPVKQMAFRKNGGGGYCVFCNPPYGREIGAWVEKCYHEAQKENTVVVMLIPARTDTKYFHDYIYHRSEIRFIRGRLKFGNSNQGAPFPSMVVIFRGPQM